ncbi:MAG: hypothetical protein V3S07_05770 [Micropepsaceae bacterium]
MILAKLLAAIPAIAQNAEEFYAGKTVALYIGSSVGGGYEAYGTAPELVERARELLN